MQEALFIKDGIAQKITADKIESRTDYLSKYSGHLYCTTPGCNASLTFALTPNFATKKIFKTSKHSEHSENCPHRIVHTASSLYRYSSETINQALSDEHKHDILKKLYERNFEDENSATNHNTSKATTKAKTNPKGGTIARPIVSLSPDAIPATDGQRELSVRKRKANDILPEDVKKPRGIDGYAISSTVDDASIEIWLNANLSILFYNSFRDSSPEAYRQVRKIADEINKGNLSVLICCIGIVEEAKHGYRIQIMDSSLVSFNNKSALNFYIAGKEK